MKWTILAVVAVVGLSGTVELQQASAGACPRWADKTGPTGITLKLCMDGKYSTCVRDSRRLGYSESTAQSYCGRLRAEGRVQ